MGLVYTKYFQKSKAFLYPLLNIEPDNKYDPLITYISWNEHIKKEDCKLICVYKTTRTKSFKKFESENLTSNFYYESHVNMLTKQIYVFDLTSFKTDVYKVYAGKYSELSVLAKHYIVKFYHKNAKKLNIMESFLEPEDYHEDYAEYLALDVKHIQKRHELCTPLNFKRENLNKKLPFNVKLIK